MTVLINGILSEEFSAQVSEQVERVFELLNPKERMVLEKRFALKQPDRFTLAEIGQSLNVTRERIRQIEKSALQKIRRNVQNYGVYEICERAYEILKQSGGILREDLLASKLINEGTTEAPGIIQLVLSMDGRFERSPNTLNYHPNLRLASLTEQIIDKVCSAGVAYLKSKAETEDLEKLSSYLKDKVQETVQFENEFFKSLFQIHKGLKIVGRSVGLNEWRNINPRTLRDKIYYILRESKAPLHFVEISNLITGAHIDKKSVNLQAVHNELIRHDDFILIGRGIYALSEWGYSSGTVSDVIEGILKKTDSMSEEDIIKEVLKIRKVKPITITLNLKNKPQFTRIGRKQYKLKTI
jgi:hypothetical protein